MTLIHRHVIIIGAGVGGLSAALSLQRQGIKVLVFEKGAELDDDFGAGLFLTPNAMRGLKFLGVDRAIELSSNVSGELLIRYFRHGTVIYRRPDGGYYRAKYGAGHFQAHRADLHRALAAEVLAHDPVCLHLAHSLSGIEQYNETVSARFLNGTVVQGDALIGCDGSGSIVRDAVHVSKPVADGGHVAFCGLIALQGESRRFLAHGASMYVGPDRMLLHFPLRKDRLMSVLAIARQSQWHEEGRIVPAGISDLVKLYSEFDPSVLAMNKAIRPETLFKWGLREREPLQRWTLGRVALLGDAAHPAYPFFGNGTGMAIEDGVVLGRCFAAAQTVEEALQRYEKTRKSRADSVQIRSFEQVNAFLSLSAEHLNAEENVDEAGLFEYDPATTPI